jgi:two-component system nitrate/nitrite response regulator NarL
MTEAVTTLITIDDHPLYRKGVADLLEMEPALSMIGEAPDGQAGLAMARELKPDLILLDLNMKGMDGLSTLKAIKDSELDSRVIMLTVSDSESDVVDALRAGADGYLLKDMEPEDTLKYLRQAAMGRLVISDRLKELLAHALRADGDRQKRQAVELTEREYEIVSLIAQGSSNKLIARRLHISEGTVKVHVKHILKKLRLHSRIEVAVWSLSQQHTDTMRHH